MPKTSQKAPRKEPRIVGPIKLDQVGVRLTEESREKLSRIAVKEGRSVADTARRLLEWAVTQYGIVDLPLDVMTYLAASPSENIVVAAERVRKILGSTTHS